MMINLGKPNQIGIVVQNIDTAAYFYTGLHGIQVPSRSITASLEKTNIRYHGKPTPARAKLAFIDLPGIILELIEPVDGPSTWQAFLDYNGSGVHNFGYIVDDLESTAAYFVEQGMPIEQHGEFDVGRYVYINSTQQLGLMIELLEFNKN